MVKVLLEFFLTNSAFLKQGMLQACLPVYVIYFFIKML